jgi:hypothetical protein
MVTGPFQLAHVDHCLAPSHSTSGSAADATSGLPWLTLLVDAWEQEPLAMVISFDQPSAETDLALLRNCARRNGRLPHAVLSDHGSDFTGTVFIGALAVLGIDGFLRAEANPRSGQPVERTFGTLAESVCRGYEGFALDIPNARAISAKKHPSKGTKRNLQDFADHSEHLLFNTIPNLPSTGGGDSKLQKRRRYEQIYGEQGIKSPIDLKLLIATAPPLKESGCFEPSGAIRLNEKRFYSPMLAGADLGSSKPPLRREPDDPSIIYFALHGNWHVAKARDALRTYGRSDDVIANEASEQARDTQEQKNKRRKSLHSQPPRWTRPATAEPAPTNPNAHPRKDKETKQPSLSDVKETSKLPLAFEQAFGGEP